MLSQLGTINKLLNEHDTFDTTIIKSKFDETNVAWTKFDFKIDSNETEEI